MKKHDAFETDFKVHRDRADEVTRDGDALISQGNHNADAIRLKSEALSDKMNALTDEANARKGRLIDNSAFLQFIWKTDVVESWIADKETQVCLWCKVPTFDVKQLLL